MSVRGRGRRHWIGIVLVGCIAASAVGVGGCGSGGGGGSSNGDLCDQCGDTDGPCHDSVEVTGDDANALCPALALAAPCRVQLMCLRKLDSAQRRCFPADIRTEFFECDGERANHNTPTPTATLTPTPTPTRTATSTGPTATGLTPTPSATPSPESTPFCGNNVVEGDEECDGTDLDGMDCGDFCDGGDAGTLKCNRTCTFDFSACTEGPCCEDPPCS